MPAFIVSVRTAAFFLLLLAGGLTSCSSKKTTDPVEDPSQNSVTEETATHMANEEGEPQANFNLCQLDFAAEAIQEEIAALLEEGASLNCSCKRITKRKKLAANLPVVKKFMRNEEKEVTSHLAPIHLAIELDDLELITYMLDKGASPDFRAKGSLSPLLFAIDVSASEEILEALKTKGAKADRCPVPYSSNTDKLALFAEVGADFDLPEEKSGRTLLHKAAFLDDQGVAEFLMEQKVDLETKDDAGVTALELAAQHSFAVFQLLYPKVDLDRMGLSKKKLQSLATETGNQQVATFLK